MAPSSAGQPTGVFDAVGKRTKRGRESPDCGVTPGLSFGRSFFLGSSGEPRCRHHKTGESDIALRGKLPGHSTPILRGVRWLTALCGLMRVMPRPPAQLAPQCSQFLTWDNFATPRIYRSIALAIPMRIEVPTLDFPRNVRGGMGTLMFRDNNV
jgi:hypothetical protein